MSKTTQPADFQNALLDLMEPAIDFGGDDVNLRAESPEARKKRMRGQMGEQLQVLMERCKKGIEFFQERDPDKVVDKAYAKFEKAVQNEDLKTLGEGVEDEIFYHLQAIAYETFEKDDFAAAEPMYTFLVTLRPAETTSYIVLLTMLWKQQGAETAASAYETLAPALGTPGFLYFGADCLNHAGRKDKATEFLQTALTAIEETEAPSEEELSMKKDVESFLNELQQA